MNPNDPLFTIVLTLVALAKLVPAICWQLCCALLWIIGAVFGYLLVRGGTQRPDPPIDR